MTSQRLIDYCNELETLAELVTGQAVSVVLASELGLTVFSNCGGFYASDLSGIIREKLPERYRGHLPCIVINDAALSDAFDFYDRMQCNAVTAHECSHVSELWTPGLPVFEPEDNAKLMTVIQSEILLEPRLWAGHKAKPWAGHEAKFLRALAHVRHRLAKERVTVDPELAFPETYYGLRKSLLDYAGTLQGELEDRKLEPIAQILASEPPKEFSRMWAEDSGQSRRLILAASAIE